MVECEWMLKKKHKRRRFSYPYEVGIRLLELGNYAITGIVITQIIGENQIRIAILLFGIVLFISFYILGYLTIQKGNHDR